MNSRSQFVRRILGRIPRPVMGGVAISLVCVLAYPLAGQQEPTFSTDVKVVNVLATVRDKQGRIVSNLSKEDFSLQEDGRPQTIRYFSRESDLPLTLGLLVDTSLSQARVLDEERSASYSFLDNVLREDKDLAFLIHFDKEVELLQDLTSSRERLQAGLELLRTPEPDVWSQRGGGLPGSWPGTGPWPAPWPNSGPRGRAPRAGLGGGGTNLYDAVYLASVELMQKQPGRKALIILSDGVDTGSMETLSSALESSQRADTLIYTILFVDDEMYQSRGGFGSPGGGGMGRRGGVMNPYPQQIPPNGRAILERLSKDSGGRLFEVTRKQSVGQIYATLQEELRNQYSLGYSPDRTGADNGYHRIRLTARIKNLKVQTREGYYSQP